MGDHDTDVAEYLYKAGATRAGVVKLLCKDLSKACVGKLPRLPKVLLVTSQTLILRVYLIDITLNLLRGFLCLLPVLLLRVEMTGMQTCLLASLRLQSTASSGSVHFSFNSSSTVSGFGF